MHIVVGSYPPLFTCMVGVISLYLQQTCVFSLSIVLVMCYCNFSMELSRTFLFSYLSFCDCHLLLSVFDCHLQWGEFSSYLLCASCTSNYCAREGSTFMVLWAGYFRTASLFYWFSLGLSPTFYTPSPHATHCCSLTLSSKLPVNNEQNWPANACYSKKEKRRQQGLYHPPEHSTERPRE